MKRVEVPSGVPSVSFESETEVKDIKSDIVPGLVNSCSRMSLIKYFVFGEMK